MLVSHHYCFAHVVLRGFAHFEPWAVMASLQGPEAPGYLESTWSYAGRHLPVVQRETPEGLTARVRAIDAGLLAVVRMPPPSRPTEAYFAAVAVGYATPVEPSLERIAWVRYFTLERGVDLFGNGAVPILGEWLGLEDGAHLNHGPAAGTDEASFERRILEMLAAG